MKKAALKIKDNSGVSILLALLFVFVAVMVSTVITSGAATASRSVRYKNESQNAYLTVYSAAKYVINDIENAEYKKGKPKDELKPAEGTEVVFSDLLRQGIEKVQSNKALKDKSAAQPFIKNFNVNASCGDHSFESVAVRFYMTDNYDIKMDFCLADGNRDTNYRLTANLNNIAGKWKLGSISKGQRIGGGVRDEEKAHSK